MAAIVIVAVFYGMILASKEAFWKRAQSFRWKLTKDKIIESRTNPDPKSQPLDSRSFAIQILRGGESGDVNSREFEMVRIVVGPANGDEDSAAKNGRDDWIRTSDLTHPKRARYQAALRPDRGKTS